MTGRGHVDTLAAAQRRRGARTGLRSIRLGKRFEISLWIALLILLLLLLIAAVTTAVIEARSGFLDPDAVRPVPDRRILENMRKPDSAEFADAALQVAGDGLIVMRRDGTGHRIDRKTGLVSDESLRKDGGLVSPVIALSAGCGELGGFGAPGSCPFNEDVFALTDQGGLAIRDAGSWRTIAGDLDWKGPDGTPVEHKDLVAWATSTDSAHLLMSAGQKGLGLFDTTQSRWVDLPPEAQAHIVNTTADGVHYILAEDSGFWLGGEFGLAFLNISPTPVFTPYGPPGVVLDLERSADRMLALIQGPCPVDGAGCLGLYAIDRLTEPQRLLGEEGYFAAIDETALDYARLQNGQAVVLGLAGGYSYDPGSRGWTRLFAGPVTTHWADPDGTLSVAAQGNVYTVKNAEVTESAAFGHGRIQQLFRAPGGQLLALTEKAEVHRIGGDAPLFVARKTPFDPTTVTAAVVAADHVILLTPAGALVHDPVRRTYGWTARPDLPPEFFQPGFQLISGGGKLWAVNAGAGLVALVFVDDPDQSPKISLSAFVDLGSPVLSVKGTDQELTLTTREGVPIRVTTGPDGPRAIAQVGDARPGTGHLRAITGDHLRLVASRGSDVLNYDLHTRHWEVITRYAPAEFTVKDLALGNEVIALGTNGRVQIADPDDPKSIVGGGETWPLSSEDVTDARISNGLIYLGGKGLVSAYDPARGEIVDQWFGTTGDVSITGFRGREPLWIAGGRVWLGDATVGNPSMQAQTAWFEGSRVAVLESQAGRTRLRLVALGKNPPPDLCFFANPVPKGTEIKDAGLLAADQYLVLTDAGFSVYDLKHRRWIETTKTAGDLDTINRLGANTLLTGPQRIEWLEAFAPHDSCSDHLAALSGSALQTRSFSIDTDRQRVAAILSNGAVGLSTPEKFTPLLPAAASAPDLRKLVRPLQHSGALYFAGPKNIWRYDIAGRNWAQQPLVGLAANRSAIDVAHIRGSLVVTERAADGSYRGGLLDLGSGDAIRLRPAAPVRFGAFPYDPATLLDIAKWKDEWLYLFQDRLVRFDPIRGVWRNALTLPSASPRWSIGEIAGTLTLSDGPGRFWFLPSGAERLDGALATVAFQYRQGGDVSFGVTTQKPAVLHRIAADSAYHQCPIVPAGNSAACTQIVKAPIKIERDDLLAAHKLGEKVLLLTKDGLQRLSKDWLTIAKERMADTDYDRPLRIFDWKNNLHILTHSGKIAKVDPATGIVPLAHDLDMVTQPVTQNDLVVRTDRGLELLAQDGTLRPAFSDPFQQKLASLTETGRVWTYDPDGQAIGQDGNKAIGGIKIPATGNEQAIIPSRLIVLGHDFGAGAWIQGQDGTVRYFPERPCAPLPDPSIRLEPEFRDRFGENPEARRPAACALTETGIPVPRRAGGEQRLLHVENTGNGRILHFTESMIAIDLRGQPSPAEPRAEQPWNLPVNASSQTALLRAAITDVKGTPLLAPPRLGITGDTLFVRRRGEDIVSLPGSTEVKQLDPADAEWIEWRRQPGMFHLPLAQTSLPPEQAIVDGRFIWSAPGQMSFQGDETWRLVNTNGEFTLTANGRTVNSVRLAALPSPTFTDDGRTGFADGTMENAQGQPERDDLTRQIKVDDLIIDINRETGRFTATIPVEGQYEDAITERGFIFDGRALVGWHNGEVHAGTKGIIGPVSRIGDLIRTPPGGAQQLSHSGGRMQARQNGRVLARTDDTWTDIPDDRANRELFTAAGVVWAVKDNAVTISPEQTDQTWRTQREGLGFRLDRLRTARPTQDGIVAVSAAGTVLGASVSDLARSPRHDPNAPDVIFGLEDSQLSEAERLVWADTPQGQIVRDPASGTWATPAPDREPWRRRDPVSKGDLTVTFLQGDPVFRQRVVDMNGRERHAEFTWHAGLRFPFDYANAIHADGDTLWVATRFGLREIKIGRFDAPRHLRLFAVDSGQGNAPPLPVDAVGWPDGLPVQIHARAGGACFRVDLASPVPCDPFGLNYQVAATGPMWHWTKGQAGLQGRYRNHAGASFGPEIDITLSRWPHDTIAISVVCGGKRFELWKDRSAITVDQAFFDLSGSPPSDLVCNDADRPFGNGRTLTTGLYGVWAPTVRRFDAGWGQPDLAAAGMVRALPDIPYFQKRLRLSAETQPPQFEIRTIADQWVPLTWTGSRLAIDDVQQVLRHGTDLWLASDAGLTKTEVADDRVTVDPNAVVRLATSPEDILDKCGVDRLANFDGTDGDWPAQPGSVGRLRCTDGRSFQIDMSAKLDIGAISAAGDDPFLARTYIDQPGFWHWRNATAKPGKRGKLDIVFRDETARLSGRFDFDDLTAIAELTADHLELVTESGWWRTNPRTPALAKTHRPQENRIAVQEIDQITPDAIDPGDPVDATSIPNRLCITIGAQHAILDDDNSLRPAVACDRWAGRDGLWAYSSGDSGLLAKAKAENGDTVDRSLYSGRFSDLFLLSTPVAGETDNSMLARSKGAISRIDPDRGIVGLVSASDTALPVRLGDGTVGILGLGGIETTTGSKADLSACPALPRAAETPGLISVLRTNTDGYELTSHTPTGLARATLLCNATSAPAHWAVSAATDDIVRRVLNDAIWTSASDQLDLTFIEDVVTVHDGDVSANIETLVGHHPIRLLADNVSEKIYLLTRGEVFEADIATILSFLHDTPAPATDSPQ